MGFGALLECWETGLRVFFKRPWFWLWMGLVSSLCWFGFPFGLSWLRNITTDSRAHFDLIYPGFLAQSIFVAATQWSCATGMARLAREQLMDPKAKAVKWIEGFFGGFVTFPAAALAAWIYQELSWRLLYLPYPELTGLLLLFFLFSILLPLHEAYVGAVAQRGTVSEIFTRMARSFRPFLLTGLLGMGVMAASAAVILLILMFMGVLVFMTQIQDSSLVNVYSVTHVVFMAPVMAVYSLAWARFWQKSASVVPDQKDASP